MKEKKNEDLRARVTKNEKKKALAHAKLQKKSISKIIRNAFKLDEIEEL